MLGIRWRNMSLEDAMIEINCLITRGGKLSEHKKGMLLEATSDVEKESYFSDKDEDSV